MESLFRTRGSGVSSDVENTIVPQLLAEIDGVEGLQNVVVIGASNREDMIDPAILRPGRLDVKIKIERPDAEAAKDIFGKYLTERLPLHSDDLAEHEKDKAATVQSMIQTAVEQMYAESEENRFLEVTYANGDKEVLYFKDFNSGAMIENIVGRAKKMAIKDFLDKNQKGLRVSHLLQGLRGRVQGERGPAQHHQPGRLGPHLRKEGRTDRVHPYARHRKAGRGHRTLHRHGGEHRSVPVKGGAAAGALTGYPQPTVFRSPGWSKAMTQMISPPAQRRSRLFHTAESRSAGTGTAHASERQRYLSGAHYGRRRARRAA
ncbi:SpoVK/Ycf46/Vps4 family AAA+-type ATPase [Streptomyces ambofaciens]